MDDNYTLPHVTHESSSDTSGYIFVKNTSSMWDGSVNLTYKLNQTYPYIRGTNHVRITQAAQPSEFSYSDDELIESGFSHNYKRLVSHFNMADMSGEYGTYELEDEYAASKEIVRHKFFELDRQFLYDPLQALEYRRKFAERASYRRFCRYSGYNGEDLSDKVSFGIISGSRICGVKIIGNSSGVTTELSVYHDGFYSSVTD